MGQEGRREDMNELLQVWKVFLAPLPSSQRAFEVTNVWTFERRLRGYGCREKILPIIFSEVEVEKKELFEILPLLITSLTVVEKNETNDEKGCLPQGR